MGNEQTKWHLHYDRRRLRCSSGRLPVCRIRELDRPELEYALAQCEINAMSTEQGMFAMGTPGYVFGAQLGKAITKEVRRQEYLKRCMVLNGWMQRPGSSARAGANSYEHPRRCSRVRHSSVVRQPAFLPGSETLPLIGLDNV